MHVSFCNILLYLSVSVDNVEHSDDNITSLGEEEQQLETNALLATNEINIQKDSSRIQGTVNEHEIHSSNI